MGYGPDDNSGVIELLEGQIRYGRALSDGIADYAYSLLSNIGGCQQSAPNIKVTEVLRKALTDWFCAGIEEQVRRMKSAPRISPYAPTPETLVRLVRERDKVNATIAEYVDISEKLSEHPNGDILATYLRTMQMPLENQLESIEEQISMVQGELEKAAPQPPEPNAPHAGGETHKYVLDGGAWPDSFPRDRIPCAACGSLKINLVHEGNA